MKGPQHSRATWKRFMKTLGEGGLTASAIAAEIGTSRQYLVNAATRKGHSMSRVHAQSIERLTGWKVSSWPRVTEPRVSPDALVYTGRRPKMTAGVDAPAEAPVARERKKKPKEAGILH